MRPSSPSCLTSFRHLSGFLAVCDTGSIAHAAQRLRRARSAVSRSVHELERALGVTLFERDGERMRCNAAGRTIQARTARALGAFALAWQDNGATDAYWHVPCDVFHAGRLAVLVTLADARHVATAAARLGVSSAMVTRSVNHLERTLGRAMFTRTDDGMAPTAATLAFAVHARRSLAELGQLPADAAALRP